MTEAGHFYQAIGELQASLAVAEDGTKFLETAEGQYKAFVPLKLQQQYADKHQGQQVYWRVYPKSIEQGLAFEVVSLLEQPQRGHGQFVLQGDWVEPGLLKIWRNAVAGKVNQYNWQPRLLPISWEEALPPDESFWQLQAELIDGVFKVTAADGPFPHPPRLEKQPDFKTQKQHRESPLPKPQLQPKQATTTVKLIDWEELAPVSGKLELTIKVNTLPQVKLADGRCHFKVDCDGRLFQVSVKQKQWNKLETASQTYAEWVAAISGKLGAATADGFVLEESNIQVFERGSKSSKPEIETHTEAGASHQLGLKNEAEAKPEVETSQTKTSPSEKPNPLARPSAAQAEAKPKKIGKFNVEVR